MAPTASAFAPTSSTWRRSAKSSLRSWIAKRSGAAARCCPPSRPAAQEGRNNRLMPFICSICGEQSTRICARCTKDACDIHLCEKCFRCSDCCECEVALAEPVRHVVRMAAPAVHPEPLATQQEPLEATQQEPLEAAYENPQPGAHESPAEEPPPALEPEPEPE